MTDYLHSVLTGTFDCSATVFDTVILVDPILKPCGWFDDIFKATTEGAAAGTESRRDIWTSRKEALTYLRSKSSYKNWHPDALSLYLVCPRHHAHLVSECISMSVLRRSTVYRTYQPMVMLLTPKVWH